MKILVLNGPNINMLGMREPEIYGKETYYDLEEKIRTHVKDMDVEIEFFQSNHEGELVDKIQEAFGNTDGIVINPAAYTHTSVALLDALQSVQIPTVEVHISKIEEREAFRQISYIRSYCEKTITGHGLDGYLEAIDLLRGKQE